MVCQTWALRYRADQGENDLSGVGGASKTAGARKGRARLRGVRTGCSELRLRKADLHISRLLEERVLAKVQARQAIKPRDRPLDAAYDLFATNGISQVGIDTILANSRCAKASLYSNSSPRLISPLLSWTGVKRCGHAGGWRRRSSAAHRTRSGASWRFSMFLTAGLQENFRGMLIHQRAARIESG